MFKYNDAFMILFNVEEFLKKEVSLKTWLTADYNTL